jgi:hypothetical protein
MEQKSAEIKIQVHTLPNARSDNLWFTLVPDGTVHTQRPPRSCLKIKIKAKQTIEYGKLFAPLIKFLIV